MSHWFAAFQIHARRVEEPAIVIQIQTATERVEPIIKYGARVGFLFDHQELVVGFGKFFDQRSPGGIGGLAAFDAVGIKARQPTLCLSAVRAMRVLFVAIKVRPHRAGLC